MESYKGALDQLMYQARLKQSLIEQHQKCFDYETGTIKSEFLEEIKCPVCDVDNADVFFQKDLFKFNKCRSCSMVYLNPRLNVEATYGFYNEAWSVIYNEKKFEGGTDATVLDDQVNSSNFKLVQSHCDTAKNNKMRLLEIGFGCGFFLKKAASEGAEVYGVDVDKSNCKRAKEHFGDRIINSDLFEAKFDAEKFDIVYLRDVFEHVPNPKQLLREINRILKKGGVVFIEVPNIEALVYQIVRERHTCVFGFAHLNYWAPRTIKKVLSDTGFETVSISHESLDFTIRDISNYFASTTFTSIVPKKSNLIVRGASWFACRLFSLPFIKQLDSKLLPFLADSVGRGSVIRVVAKKS